MEQNGKRRPLFLDFNGKSSGQNESSPGISIGAGNSGQNNGTHESAESTSSQSISTPHSLSLPLRPPSLAISQSQPTGSYMATMGHPTQIERLRSHSHTLESTGRLQISPEQIFDFTAEDLEDRGEIGRGAYGCVNKMWHTNSSTLMAVKRIRSTVDEKEQKQLLMDLDVVMRSNECPYIVQFYGALFKEGDAWICMELLNTSLDKFYKFVTGTLQQSIPEEILGKITLATVKALSYLKEKLKIIHRDVKPSNILLGHGGAIKLCDFGISGQLIDSIAKTRDAGCRPYMAPERIDPRQSGKGYDIRSDVWSLGITLVEVATGKFPYRKWNSVFDQLTEVVQGRPPKLDAQAYPQYSNDFISFVDLCLSKEEKSRPKYNKLLETPFIKNFETKSVDVGGFVSSIIDQYPVDLASPMDTY